MTGALRVRQVPAAHAYVENLRPLQVPDRVVHLADPPVPGAAPGQWWPHPALDAAWVRAHADEQDIVHVHFGTEGRSLAELTDWIAALRAARLPLVHTVHDIDHPHLVDQGPHREQLALLVAQADGLLTLTQGAAGVIERNYGRRPLVVPHPHVVPLARIRCNRTVGSAPSNRTVGSATSNRTVGSATNNRTVGSAGPLRVGIHLKSLRTNVAPMRVLPALVEAVGALRAAGTQVELEVRAHPEALDPTRPPKDPDLVRWWHALASCPPPGVHLVVAPRLDDDELWDYLEALDVSVLPYAWGTHSGWVEACRDLGTAVLAARIGHLHEQGAGSVLTWGDPGMPPDPAVLVDRLSRVVAARDGAGSGGEAGVVSPGQVTRAWRAQQREQIAAAHARVYAAVVAGDRVDAAAEELV